MHGSEGVGEVTGVILAGGLARRFGGVNKATLALGGQRIIDHQLAALQSTTARQLIVASDRTEFADLGVPVVADLVSGVGPLGGLHTALTVIGTTRALVLAGDLPFVDAAFLRFLVSRAPEADAVVPCTLGQVHPLCGVYARSLLPVVAARVQQRQLTLHSLLEVVTTVYVEPHVVATFDPGGRLLSNINTPADYAAALATGGWPVPATPPDATDAT